MPSLRVENLGDSLKVLYSDNSDLTKDRRYTFLTEDVFLTGSTIRVQSLIGFETLNTSSGQVLLLGEVGNERTEIVRTSQNTNLSSTYKEVTLRDNMVFDHPQDTKVTIIDWDRVEFQYAASATGTKTTIVAYPLGIRPDQNETVFRDLTEPANRLTGAPTTAFYFTRYNNTIEGRNSNYSDPMYGAGLDDNMVGSIKRRALEELGEDVDGKVITQDFLNKTLWQARREYHQSPGKRPFRRKFNVDIGDAFTGSYRIDLPTDVERPFTSENVYGVRIGPNQNMRYIDKKEWDWYYYNKPHTTLTAAYTVGATDLYVLNARDFSGSGAVSIEGTSISYSDKSNSGGTLRISTQGSWNASAGSEVWQNVTYGLPDKFTVFGDPGGSCFIYFNMPIDTAYIGQNIYADYYRTLVGYDSDVDVLDEPSYDLYVAYLKAKIKQRKAKGEFDLTKDSDYKVWLAKKQEQLSRETLASNITLEPDIDHLPIAY